MIALETQFLIGVGFLCPFCSNPLRFLLGPTHGRSRRDRSNIAVARFLDMPRRIAQERVPTASNLGSRDATWVVPAQHLSSPFASFRVFRGPLSSVNPLGFLSVRR